MSEIGLCEPINAFTGNIKKAIKTTRKLFENSSCPKLLTEIPYVSL